MLILLGLFAHFAEPIQENKVHTEFASWLNAKVKTENDSSVRQLIDELSYDKSELNEVIRKASDIVSNNSDDFELPVSDDDSVLEVIIDQWNAYQNAAAGMGKAVITENVKSNAISQKDGLSQKKFTKVISETCLNNLVSVEAGWNSFTAQKLPVPFKSGVAINAP